MRRAFSIDGYMRELVYPAVFRQALHRWLAVTFSITRNMPDNDGFREAILYLCYEYLANVYLMGRDGD